ncbi:hypothetical protein [Mycobacterium sp. ACS4331]|uniref:hypothetical protein n=1 Tax=Mycobacterium sp. ACS4331 TaxID=1834121 RepID=UPI000800055B|nr:hypothetical protein [Mycobacterium sp. ACS4331]OBF29141.1 hypothetical protein A5727_24155 [Mycobacterium sp. ACS4331]
MRTVIIAGIAGVLASGGIAMAGPATAGCQSAFISIFGGGQRCDGPIDQLGNFTRCDSGHGMGFGGSNCYVVNVSDPAQAPRIP